jgi:hypothetical protein
MHGDDLGNQAVNGDPGVNSNDRSKEYGHELVVARDVHEVLVAESDTQHKVHNQQDPSAYRSVAD